MCWELRLYRAKAGELDDFVREWRAVDPDPARHIAGAEHVCMDEA